MKQHVALKDMALLVVKPLRPLVFTWLGLNVLDIFLTSVIGWSYESNFLPGLLVRSLGADVFTILKLLGAIIVVLVLFWWRRMALLKVLNVAMGLVVVWNWAMWLSVV